jgi:dihydroorotase
MAFSRGQLVEIPSPIDVHAHLREPGGTPKETIESGTRAALLGGYALVLDMPNNPGGYETWTEERVLEKARIATATAQTDFGIIAGHDFTNPRIGEYENMIPFSLATKGYFGHTTGNTREVTIEDEGVWAAYTAWTAEAKRQGIRTPHMLHAREQTGYLAARRIIEELDTPVHWCHVSTTTEVNYAEMLQRAYPEHFTSGVTPHHLTMTHKNAELQQGWNARMMPPLGKEIDNDKLLWAFNKGIIDILETDHAPHTEEEKLHAEAVNPEGKIDASDPDCVSCFGISGIEFVLPIMSALVQRGHVTMDRVVDALHTQPLRMLGLTRGQYAAAKTTLQFEPWQITERDLKGKSSNTPYLGNMAGARVVSVTVNETNWISNKQARAVVTPERRVL